MQKKIVRTMTFSPYLEHTNPIFSRLKILKLVDIIKLKQGITVYKYIKKNQIQDNHNNLFTLTYIRQIHSYNTKTRARDDLYVPSVQTELGKSAPQYQLPKTWNEIPIVIRNTNNSKHFKTKFKDHLLTQYN